MDPDFTFRHAIAKQLFDVLALQSHFIRKHSISNFFIQTVFTSCLLTDNGDIYCKSTWLFVQFNYIPFLHFLHSRLKIPIALRWWYCFFLLAYFLYHLKSKKDILLLCFEKIEMKCTFVTCSWPWFLETILQHISYALFIWSARKILAFKK